MSHTLIPTTEPRLIQYQINHLMAHLLRLPTCFDAAKGLLQVGDLDSVSALVWGTALSLEKQHGKAALFGDLTSARMLVFCEVLAQLESRRDEFSQEEADRFPELLQSIYGVPQEHLIESYGRQLLKRHLLECKLQRPAEDFLADASGQAITDFGPFLEVLRKRASAIQLLDGKPARTAADEIAVFEERLQIYKGREIIGLRTGLDKLDAHTLGLRGLIVLGAGPGVGKTTLALQMGLGICEKNDDAAFMMLSLEMDRWSMYTRLLCNLARLDWKTVVLGSEPFRAQTEGPWFTEQDNKKLEDAKAMLSASGIGNRIMILDRELLGEQLTTDTVLGRLNEFKARTHCSRAFIALDYVQRIPVPPTVVKHGELEADRYRVQVLQDLAEATKTGSNPVGDAVLAISETRKPSGKKWGGNLADLMGSARLPYAVDAALLYQPMQPDEAGQYDWSSVSNQFEEDSLSDVGVSPVRLELAKGRDGMQRGEWAVAFHFRESRFTEIASQPKPTLNKPPVPKKPYIPVEPPPPMGYPVDPTGGVNPFSS